MGRQLKNIEVTSGKSLSTDEYGIDSRITRLYTPLTPRAAGPPARVAVLADPRPIERASMQLVSAYTAPRLPPGTDGLGIGSLGLGP